MGMYYYTSNGSTNSWALTLAEGNVTGIYFKKGCRFFKQAWMLLMGLRYFAFPSVYNVPLWVVINLGPSSN
jgi:hypothetical protein